LDVGCNDGQTTRWFLDMFENPTIYCFEPDPRAIARFKQKVGDRPNVTLFELAVSDREGSLDFYQSGGKLDDPYLAKAMPEGWDLSGSIKQPYRHLNKHPLVTFDNKIQVPTETLDSVCARCGIGTVDLIWLDVQGAEIEVFDGARATLAQTKYLYTEYSNRQLYKGQRGLRQIVKHLEDFSVVARYPGDALLCNRLLAATGC
jgi:2-O-methyltransferase